ncbi:MAG: glutathione S-transferase N-terminal domain-containing protein [Pseudomonadota bacterium]
MIDLYTCATANGQKASIILEECGLAYKAHTVDLYAGEHRSPAFLAINPVGKVPAIVDAEVAGEPINIGESLAICYYAAEKTGKLLPERPAERAAMHQWASVAASGFGAAFSGLFWARHLAPEQPDWVAQRFIDEAERCFAAMNDRLGESEFLAGADYSIADVLAYPVAATSSKTLDAGIEPYANIHRRAPLVANIVRHRFRRHAGQERFRFHSHSPAGTAMPR